MHGIPTRLEICSQCRVCSENIGDTIPSAIEIKSQIQKDRYVRRTSPGSAISQRTKERHISVFAEFTIDFPVSYKYPEFSSSITHSAVPIRVVFCRDEVLK